MAWETYTGGKITEQGNDTTRTVTTYNTNGTTKATRPYAADENAAADQAAADQAAAAAALAANEAALRNGLQAAIDAAHARQAEYQTVLNATNATINGSPASHIKAVARQGKRSERALIRLIRLVGGLTTTADTGTD